MSQMKTELLLGCGNSREKRMWISGQEPKWSNLITIDHDEDCNPDFVWDLETCPYPFQTNQFDEVHAYEVLEHTGPQGDYVFFFIQFSELHRILKPNGLLFATVPAWNSIWAWGDPSHKRVISPASLTFLSQEEYTKQVGKTAMSDFREIYKVDFKTEFAKIEQDTFQFTLRAIK